MVTDSGGLRELFIDRAETRAVPLAKLSDRTTADLKTVLPHGLPASNPLDCAGIMSDGFASVFERALLTVGAAPEVSLVGYEIDARDDHTYNDELLAIAKRLPQMTGKPCFAYSCFAQAHNRDIGDGLADAGLPQLNGLDETLSAIAALRALRDLKRHIGIDDPPPAMPDAAAADTWSDILSRGGWQGEAAGLKLLNDFGIRAVSAAACKDIEQVHNAAEELDYPVVLKTAEDGIAHKSDVGGVVVGIADREALETAYSSMLQAFGPKALIQEMASPGIELAFGYIRDPDFGPLVMLAAGGTLIEVLGDRQFALAPFGVGQADRMLRKLKLFPLLAGLRGAPACDTGAITLALARFSVMCAALGDHITELDVNPVIVNAQGVTAVDAFIGAAR
jgi:acetyltransferase